MKMTIPVLSIGVFIATSAWSQSVTPVVIEVEASGKIEFVPDSFWVSIRSSSFGIYDEDIVVEAMPDDNSDRVLSIEPPAVESQPVKDAAQMSDDDKKQLQRIDSMRMAREQRTQELERIMQKLKIGPEYAYKMPNETRLDMMNRYTMSKEWVQIVDAKQYAFLDSLKKNEVRGLRMDLITVVVNSDKELKTRAYKKAMEEAKTEAEILAGAMGKKLGKLTHVATESMGIEDFLPIVMGRELRREFRKKDRLGPSIYQLSRELGITDELPDDQNQAWTWTEKVNVKYQTQ